MNPRLASDLSQLPRLDGRNAAAEALACKICGGTALRYDIADFNKTCSADLYPFGLAGIPVTYCRCRVCGFIFTDLFDDWTPEDFAAFIYNDDYALVDGEYAHIRPERTAEEMAKVLADYRSAAILDYGSGSGAFAQRLKAHGFRSVDNYDPFSSPARPATRFKIVTCFETIEHSPRPVAIMTDLLSFMEPDGCLILGTGIQPPNIDELRCNWWYIAPRNGHVSIYTWAALELLGARFGLDLYCGSGHLALARPDVGSALTPLLDAIGNRTSFVHLAAPDHGAVAAKTTPRAVPRIADWHGVELAGATRFRWSRSGRIEWTLQGPPLTAPRKLVISMPLLMEISPGFIERSVLQVDARDWALRRANGTITATAVLDRPLDGPIALITPPPQRPSDMRGSPDARPLGLAVPI